MDGSHLVTLSYHHVATVAARVRGRQRKAELDGHEGIVLVVSPRPRKSEEELDAILVIVAALIADKGLVDIRYAEISASAGVSVGTLQHYFGSLEDLLLAAFDYYDTLQSPLARHGGEADSDPWGEIEHRVDRLVGVREIAVIAAMWARVLEPGHPFTQLREKGRSSYALWVTEFNELVKAGVDTDRLRPALAGDDLTGAVIALLDGFSQGIALGTFDEKSARRIVKRTLRVLLGVKEHRPATVIR